MEPNKEAITAWVQALESGRFRQTKGKLATPKMGRLCALGVRNFVYLELNENLVNIDLFALENASGRAVQWVGVHSFEPFIDIEALPYPIEVSEANDEFDLSLSEIAQHLRKKYL